MNKINVLPIISRHLDTLSNYGEEKRSWVDLTLFYVFPVLGGIVLALLKFGFRIDAVNGFLNAFSILTGLLLNVLVLVLSLTNPSPTLSVDLRLRRELLREVFANICVSILVSVGVVCTAIVALSYMKSQPGAQTGPVATFLLTSCTLNFVLTLLMVIKRMYSLLDKELERNNPLRKTA
jgi:Kef-type K+ transport system membrane component KefB